MGRSLRISKLISILILLFGNASLTLTDSQNIHMPTLNNPCITSFSNFQMIPNDIVMVISGQSSSHFGQMMLLITSEIMYVVLVISLSWFVLVRATIADWKKSLKPGIFSFLFFSHLFPAAQASKDSHSYTATQLFLLSSSVKLVKF